jgi:hypothetical protein
MHIQGICEMIGISCPAEVQTKQIGRPHHQADIGTHAPHGIGDTTQVQHWVKIFTFKKN